MFNVGGGEILVIMVLALIVLGPDKLPEAARQAGKYLSEFRRMSQGFQNEIRTAMDLTGDSGPAPPAPTEPPGQTTTPAGAQSDAGQQPARPPAPVPPGSSDPTAASRKAPDIPVTMNGPDTSFH